MKKLLIALGVFGALLVAAAGVVPLVVDVDQYRPQLVELANQKIDGKLELGKLKLSLWGQIRVEVGGLKLTDSTGSPVVQVEDAYFHLPFSSIFAGSPLLTFKMQKPSVHVIKNKSGKLNVMALLRSAPKTEAPAESEVQAKEKRSQQTSATIALPAIATRARLGVELSHAELSYQDQLTGVDARVQDFNLTLKDISLSRPTEMEIVAQLDTKLGKTFAVKGPVRMHAQARPEFEGQKFSKATVTFLLNLDDLEIEIPGVFQKKAGVLAKVDGTLSSSEAQAAIERLNFRFHNAELTAEGKILNVVQSPTVNLKLDSNEIEFAPWVELVPMLKAYELGGSAELHAAVNGPAEKLTYQAAVRVKKLTAKAPGLKAQPTIDGEIQVVTDQIEKISFTLKAPGTEIRLTGKLASFLSPRVELQVSSPGMDLDQLVDFQARTAAKAAQAKSSDATASKASGSTAPAATADLDALLEPLRKNPIAARTTATLGVNIKSLKAMNVAMTDLSGRMTFKDLTATIDGFGLKIFDGSVQTSATVALKPQVPTYRFSLKVDDLELKKAVESQFSILKNTVLGQADFKMEGQGSSFNTDRAIGSLSAKGSMKISKATLATIDVGKMAGEALNKAIEKLSDKVPAVKGKSIKVPGGRESRYELISSDFTIGSGKFSAPNFSAKAEANQGIDFSGRTTVGLKDMSLDTAWEIVDTYNVTKAYDLSVEVAGTQVPHILSDKGKPVRFPVSAGCKVVAPCYSYTEVPEFLAKVALANVGQAATGRAKAEIQKKAEEFIRKQAPPSLQEAAKGLTKKLFGR